jgi:hypothetical protein
MRMLAGAVLAPIALVLGVAWLTISRAFKTEIRERAVERITLPGGEILTNASSLFVGFRGSARCNELSFQSSESAQREMLGTITRENEPPISQQNSSPLVVRRDGRLAVVVGGHIFRRATHNGKPYWSEVSVSHPDLAARAFLRSFLSVGAPEIGTRHVPSYTDSGGGIPVGALPFAADPNYQFHTLELRDNILVTQRAAPSTVYPEFLVFSAARHDFSWQLDLDRTRAINHLSPPPDGQFTIEVSDITFPGRDEHQLGWKRDELLSRTGAREWFMQALPLPASGWQGINCPIVFPDGSCRVKQFEVRYGFQDPLPGVLSVSWRRVPVLSNEWCLVAPDTWVRAEATRFDGGLSHAVFFRVRKNGRL